MEDKTINLCDTCKFHIAECTANFEDNSSKFGLGVGFDNVYECIIYEKK